MLEGHHLKELAAIFEHFDYNFIRLFGKQPVESGKSLVEATALVDELNHGEAVALAHLVVVLAERGRNVNDARAVAHGDVGVAYNVVRFYFCTCGGNALNFRRRLFKQRLIFQPLPLAALLFGYDFIVLKEV